MSGAGSTATFHGLTLELTSGSSSSAVCTASVGTAVWERDASFLPGEIYVRWAWDLPAGGWVGCESMEVDLDAIVLQWGGVDEGRFALHASTAVPNPDSRHGYDKLLHTRLGTDWITGPVGTETHRTDTIHFPEGTTYAPSSEWRYQTTWVTVPTLDPGPFAPMPMLDGPAPP
ncbi:MAG: hypothetical protein H6742_01055 [Alphaproteobacteria bacterium]|nr:hypothetical protein [Alphaproteobacteria bacterium]